MLQFAFAAVLLMVLAPLVSRALQAPHQEHGSHPGHDAHAEVALSSAPEHAHPDHHHAGMTAPTAEASDSLHTAHAHGAAPVDAGPAGQTSPSAPADPHALHGEACDYCLMASRLLPWLAVCLLLLPLLWRPLPPARHAVVHHRALRWPAHAARGPPLHSIVR